MTTSLDIKEKIKKVFPAKQASVLVEIVNRVDDTVKAKDFNELKAIVAELAFAQKELAEAQKRTEQRLEELAEAQKRTEQRVEELAEAQKRTEQRVEELAEAQKRTEQRLEELAEAQKRTEQRVEELAEAQEKTEKEIAELTKGLKSLRKEVGGLSRTMSYAFENEAFRMLPKFLENKFGLHIKEKLVRAEISDREINIFGKARKDGKEIYIVGESKLRLDERKEQTIRDVFNELNDKVEAVKRQYGDVEILRLLITHYATKKFLKEAEKEGILIIQSFEW